MGFEFCNKCRKLFAEKGVGLPLKIKFKGISKHIKPENK